MMVPTKTSAFLLGTTGWIDISSVRNIQKFTEKSKNLSETEDRPRFCGSFDFCLPEPFLLPQCPWTWTVPLGRTGGAGKNRSWKSRRIELHF
jgi:hypothetical protein